MFTRSDELQSASALSAAAVAQPRPAGATAAPSRWRGPVQSALGLAAPGLTVAVVALLALVVAGVPVRMIAVWSLYWVGFIALPGALTASVLLRGSGRLLVFAVGCVIGYTLELLAASAAAAVGHRALVWAYPPLVLAAALWARRRSPAAPIPRTATERGSARTQWALAASALAAFGAVMPWFWIQNRWPVTAPSTYEVDLPNHLGWSADALHHFPPSNPSVAGITQEYHWFFYLHIANGAEVTGLSVPYLLLRFAFVPMVLLIPVLVAVAAIRLSGRAWAGPIAALTGTVVGELVLMPIQDAVAFGDFAHWASYSPTYVYGLVFAAGALVLGAELLRDDPQRRGWRPWAALALVLAGASGAKATILPLIGAGFALAAAYALVRRRWAVVRSLALGGAVLVTIQVLAQLLVYGGSSPKRTELHLHILQAHTLPFWAMAQIVAPGSQPLYSYGTPALLPAVTGTAFTFAILLTPFAGALALLRHRQHRAAQVFLLGVLLGGVAVSSLIMDPYHSEQWFLVMALPAAGVLAGWGTAELLAGLAGARRAQVLAAVAAAVLALTAALVALRGGTMPRRPIPATFTAGYAAVWALVLAAGAAAFLLAGRRGLGGLVGKSRLRIAAAVTVCAAVGACLPAPMLHVVYPLDAYYGRGLRIGPSSPYRTRADVTPSLMSALTWIRTHTRPSDVIAVDNHCLIAVPGSHGGPEVCQNPHVFYYSAFSERRYLLESAAYTDEMLAWELLPAPRPPALFASRERANDQAFADPAPDRLRALRDRYGVRYLLADTRPHFRGDRRHPPSPKLATLADPVFRDSDAVVFRLR